jgi:alkaline phosphatase D
LTADAVAAPKEEDMSRLSRREWLKLAAAGLLVAASPRSFGRPEPLASNPFTLGVASGYPSPTGVVLWTRLAPEPLAPRGGMGEAVYPVRYEIAGDEQFREIVQSGTEYALPEWGHSLHLEVEGLAADRPYWYRFMLGDATSPVGRTRTAPAKDAAVDRLRFAIASCQHYEHGYFSAYRHMRADDLDLVLHLGDYIYEGSWGADPVRQHEATEPMTLEQYRARYARYKLDTDLQAAHAACPWLLTWDDHEVENDYASERSENADEPAWFLARRAAAYQAYFEHMPLRRAMTPNGPWLRLHTRQDWGALATLHMLDDRQYRSPQPCPKPGRAGSNMVDGRCPGRFAAESTLLGERQEQWLKASLSKSEAPWNLLGQQTLMAQADARAGKGTLFYSDGWDGYPLARQRLLDFLADSKTRNPVVLGGDVHSFWVNDLKRDFDDPESAIVASEFVTTSITSYGPPPERFKAARDEGAHIHFASGERRGYTRFTLTPKQLQADLRALVDAQDAATACDTIASYVVQDGRPGPQGA